MISKLIFTVLLFLIAPSFVNSEGSVVIIGGALQTNNDQVYNKIIDLAGGKHNIRLAIFPTASGTPTKTSLLYQQDFIGYGVAQDNIHIIPLAIKDDPTTKELDESQWIKNGNDQKVATTVAKCNAAFFVGGDQERYIRAFFDNGEETAVLKSIRKLYSNGGVLAGTSAGAAIMSDPMIYGGDNLTAMIAGTVTTGKGCGFFTLGIVDQHFMQRGRYGRLLVAAIQHNKIGFGIDENTALVTSTGKISVVGQNGVLIMDTRHAKIDPHSGGTKVQHVILHYLQAGDEVEWSSQKLKPNTAKQKITTPYYQQSVSSTDIFSTDCLRKLITQGVVDNSQKQATGVSFLIDEQGKGTKWVLRGNRKTFGYWGKVDGVSHYSAWNVILDVFPIKIRLTEY
ncbi:cyanophycinase [Candidatus Uabimicrobium amorphum]|uniref:Cyanophycinase n=1 Tax=Uabimicrobium amorphum TaxID=2596890 RepID=A0A5S9F1F7_UABAM|nr:cyanophycinase [Candidatus Uabimicrobium amorphum]BBM82141.1 cyanophycinase [Candidatus Uabimicrobium amorphum]